MDYEDLSNLAAAIQSFATVASFAIGGFWVYRKYVREVEKYPHIESAADLKFIGQQGDFWIVEFAGILENKGKVRHRINSFSFDVNALFADDPIETDHRWGGQVNFPNRIAEGSFLPARYDYFFIDPGVKARYSFNGRVPKQATMLLLHCWFEYVDQPGHGHAAELAVSVPSQDAP
jgi:hypothetical protein